MKGIRKWVIGSLVFILVIYVYSLFMFNKGGSGAVLATADSWLGFTGAVLGGIISGAITLIVLFVSLQKQQESINAANEATKATNTAAGHAKTANEIAKEANNMMQELHHEEIRLSIMPVFTIEQIEKTDLQFYSSVHYFISNDGEVSNDVLLIIKMKNIGMGNCLTIEPTLMKWDNKPSAEIPYPAVYGKIYEISCIHEDSVLFGITLSVPANLPSLISITFRYCDVMNNAYSRDFCYNFPENRVPVYAFSKEQVLLPRDENPR